MNKNKNKIYGEVEQKSLFSAIADSFFIISSLYLCLRLSNLSWNDQYFIITLIAVISFFLMAEVFQLYRPWRVGSLKKLYLYTLISWSFSLFVVLLFVFFFEAHVLLSRSIVGLWFSLVMLELLLWRYSYRYYLNRRRKKGYDIRKVVILGMTQRGLALAEQIRLNPQSGLKLLGFFDDRDVSRLPVSDQNIYLGKIKKALLFERLGTFDTVYIALPLTLEKRINSILKVLANTNLKVHLIPNLFTFNLLNSRISYIGEMQAVSAFESPFSGLRLVVKRIEDIVIASIIMCLISIPMLIIACLIKLDSKGPVIFRQTRYGLDEKPIKVWKFRSMTVEDNGATVKQATKGDARITKLGAILRKTSLDELPQFINVIKGDMSIVGPRPHAVSHNEEYRSLVDFYMLRSRVKPGITGWAQINGWRGETDTLDKMEKRVEFDIAYMKNWSLYFDIKIIFLTIFKGFVNKNAY